MSWFRAKARSERWEEQLLLVKSHMSWTINTFKARQRDWLERASVEAASAGAKAYAFKEAEMWGMFALEAGNAFSACNQ